MLRDEPLEYIKKQYDEKNSVLEQFGRQVSAWTLYEDVFGDLGMVMPVVFIDEDDSTKHIVSMSIEDALEQAEQRNDVLMGGCTYFNNWISKRSAKDIYAFIIDMDNVYSGILLNALRNDWKTANGEVLPMPTYIVNSGTGLHLYFVFTEPIPNYRCTTESLDKLYRALAVQQTTKRVYLQKQVHWFGQDFRMAGGRNKYSWTNTCFKVGVRWDIDSLGSAVGLEGIHFVRYGEPRTRKPKASAARQSRQGWRSSRAFYDYALKMCHEKTREGNRYTSMMALSVIAWKCGVSREELERGLVGLLPDYNKNTTNPFREKEIYSAMKMYNEKAMLTQRESLENWQGWEYKPIKRNGRKQEKHLQLARGIRELKGNMGEVVSGGGRPSSKKIVVDCLRENPFARKCDVIKETGLSKKTVYKYYDAAKKEAERFPTLNEMLWDALEESGKRWMKEQKKEKGEKHDN